MSHGRPLACDGPNGNTALRRVAQRTHVSDFVQRFLTTLSNSIDSNSKLSQDLCHMSSQMSDDNPKTRLSASKALRQAREAIGQDTDAYLQMGLSILWSGDLTESDETLLYPSSVGGPAGGGSATVGAARIRSQVAVLESLLEQTLDERQEADEVLEHHAPAVLAYLLEVDEIRNYVQLSIKKAQSNTKTTTAENSSGDIYDWQMHLKPSNQDQDPTRPEKLRKAIAECLLAENAKDYNTIKPLLKYMGHLISRSARKFVDKDLPLGPEGTHFSKCKFYAEHDEELAKVLDLEFHKFASQDQRNRAGAILERQHLDNLGYADNVAGDKEEETAIGEWLKRRDQEQRHANSGYNSDAFSQTSSSRSPYVLAGLADDRALGAPGPHKQDVEMAEIDDAFRRLRIPECIKLLQPDQFEGTAEDASECFGSRFDTRAAASLLENMITGGFARYGPHQVPVDPSTTEDGREKGYHTPVVPNHKDWLDDLERVQILVNENPQRSQSYQTAAVQMQLQEDIPKPPGRTTPMSSGASRQIYWTPAVVVASEHQRRVGALSVTRATKCISYATHLKRCLYPGARQAQINTAWVNAVLKLEMMPALKFIYDTVYAERRDSLSSHEKVDGVVQSLSNVNIRNTDWYQPVCGVLPESMLNSYAVCRSHADALLLESSVDDILQLTDKDITEYIMKGTNWEPTADVGQLQDPFSINLRWNEWAANNGVDAKIEIAAAIAQRATFATIKVLREKGLINPSVRGRNYADMDVAYGEANAVGYVVGRLLYDVQNRHIDKDNQDVKDVLKAYAVLLLPTAINIKPTRQLAPYASALDPLITMKNAIATNGLVGVLEEALDVPERDAQGNRRYDVQGYRKYKLQDGKRIAVPWGPRQITPRPFEVNTLDKRQVHDWITDHTDGFMVGLVPSIASPEGLADILGRVEAARVTKKRVQANINTYRQALLEMADGGGGPGGGPEAPGGPGGGGLGAFGGATPNGAVDRHVDANERSRRAAIWEDSLRELSVSGDRLYVWLKTMAGTLHEDVQSIIELEDTSMEEAFKAQKEQRREALKNANAFSQRVVDQVLAQVFKSSKLKVDLSGMHQTMDGAEKAAEAAAASLVVVSDEVIERVGELATGSSGMGFVEANEQLRSYLETRQTSPVTLRVLISELKTILDDHRRHVMNNIQMHHEETGRATISYLAEPRNSLVVRLKNETFAAIRTAYDLLVTEMRSKGLAKKIPSAYTCIEGGDRLLTDQFAQLAAYQLAHSRIFSSSSSIYVGVTPAKMNMVQLRTALEKTVRRAIGR